MTQTIAGAAQVAQRSPNYCEIEHVYIYRDGLRLHYQVAGPLDAPPLVLLHGVGGNVNWWQENFGEFSRHFRTYALDLPGFGKTWRLRQPDSIEAKAAFVRGWLDWMGLGKVNLLGHSMGGQVAIRLAALHPELIERLVLAAPSGLWLSLSERMRWAWQMPKVKVPLRQTLTIATGSMRTDMVAFGMALRAILADRETSQNLEQLKVPTLLVWGRADGVVPPALGPRHLNLIGQAPVRLEYIERGTHNAMFDQAESFNRLVLDFLI